MAGSLPRREIYVWFWLSWVVAKPDLSPPFLLLEATRAMTGASP